MNSCNGQCGWVDDGCNSTMNCGPCIQDDDDNDDDEIPTDRYVTCCNHNTGITYPGRGSCLSISYISEVNHRSECTKTDPCEGRGGDSNRDGVCDADETQEPTYTRCHEIDRC